MISNAMQSLKYTPFIKIKYIDDVLGLFSLFQSLEKASVGNIKKYIVDANASWSIESAKKFNHMIQEKKYQGLKEKILYIEQPFPICMSSEEQQLWANFKEISVIKIIVDQSFAGH